MSPLGIKFISQLFCRGCRIVHLGENQFEWDYTNFSCVTLVSEDGHSVVDGDAMKERKNVVVSSRKLS